MANITAQSAWDEVYIIAEDDPVQGGKGGIDNLPHQQLANRTAFLKEKIDKVTGNIPAGEDVSLATVLQRLKDLENKPAPTFRQFMIPVGGLFETAKLYFNGNELATDMGYGVWERFGEGRITLGLTATPVDDGAGNIGIFNQIGEKFGEYDHVLTVDEMPSHSHIVNINTHDINDAGYPAIGSSSATKGNEITTSVGDNQSHNNMPPVIVVGRWLRTA